jgi:hypothetical protein
VIRIEVNRAFEFLEAAIHVTKEMANLETDRGMDRIDLVDVVRVCAQKRNATDRAEKQKK